MIIFLSSLILLSPYLEAAPSAASFSAYVRQYEQPEFFSSNDSAFDARLKLLDQAPAGARARVATFVFENSATVRRLARHLCLASQRGVQVELLIDSKSGGRPGYNDSFDKNDGAQVIEDILQYLANCKVAVHVHNQQSSYIEMLGFRLPNIFLDAESEGRKFGLFHLPKILKRISFLMERASTIIEQEFAAAGVEADPRPLLKNLRSLALTYAQGMGGAGGPSASSMKSRYEKILLDPIWDKVSAAKVRQVLPKIEARFHADSVFGPLGEKIRRYNRLNHRKLFLVETNSGEGCMILGGRNLGDHYLADSATSYLDGDMLLCRHQSHEISDSLDAGLASFENLLTDKADPYIGKLNDNLVYRVKPNHNYIYRSLAIPGVLLPPRAQFEKYKGKLELEERSLLREKGWRDGAAVHGQNALPSTSGWRLLLAGWDPSRDEVHAELLRLVNAEKKEIFIETAYAEFDAKIRNALEGAMKRGVNVQLITNSFFTSDGPSGLIRILMSTWNEKMAAQYPGRFDVRYTALSGGHMTHFKFAAFGCQEGNQRAYLIGSHNFHPRSGNADKEHMLAWNEPGDCGAKLSSVSLVQARHNFYNQLAQKTRKRILDQYPSLFKELTIVGNPNLPRKPQSGMADALLYMFYEETDLGIWRPRMGGRAQRIFRLLDDSGLHDLMGRIL